MNDMSERGSAGAWPRVGATGSRRRSGPGWDRTSDQAIMSRLL
jgi:hypothetical protein